MAPGEPSASPADLALRDRWAETVRGLLEAQRLSGLGRELALQSQCQAITADVPALVQLVVEHESLATPGARDKLAEGLTSAWGHAVRLEIAVGVVIDSLARREAARRARRQREAEQAVQADPVVQEILGQFSTARIVPGSIKPI